MMFHRRPRDERGATAVLVALMATILFGAAALAVDYSSLVMERQNLHDHIDSAAQSGAYELPSSGASAAAAARSIALAQDGTINPTVDLYCVVASTGTLPYLPNITQIPSTCYPGPPPYSLASYTGMRCNEFICAIPCPQTGTGIKCNTVQVSDNKTVGFSFARILGVPTGRTGSVASAACKGACGAEVPNPLDIVIMADRTASMASADRAQMKMAILNSLKTMTPALHHVAFGALAKSRVADYTTRSSFSRPAVPATPSYEDCSRYTRGSTQQNLCNARNQAKQDQYDADYRAWQNGETAFAKSTGWDGTGETDNDGICHSEAVRLNDRDAAATRNEGTWITDDFTNTYLLPSGDLNNANQLVDSVSCLPESASGEYGTNIGASLKAAVRKAIAGSTVPGASSRPGTPRKVVIFETDGQPDEIGSASGSTQVSNSEEVWSGQQSTNSGVRNGTNGCNRFKEVATNAKNAGVIVITIGFGGATTGTCERYFNFTGEQRVKDVLAAGASDSPNGGPSTAGDCSTSTGIQTENTDGDYFFCATQGDELSDIFKTALNQVSNGIKLIRLP